MDESNLRRILREELRVALQENLRVVALTGSSTPTPSQGLARSLPDDGTGSASPTSRGQQAQDGLCHSRSARSLRDYIMTPFMSFASAGQNVTHTAESETQSGMSSSPTQKAKNMEISQQRRMKSTGRFAKQETEVFLLHIMHDMKAQFIKYRIEPDRSGCLFSVVHSVSFKFLTSFVILINGVFTFFSANWHINGYEDTNMTFIRSAEITFLACYAVELALRLSLHRFYFFVNNDWAWNVFDLLLVFFSVVEEILKAEQAPAMDLVVFRCVRIVKVARALRVFKVVHLFVELRQLLSAVINCCTSLVWSLLTLALFYFLFAVIFVEGAASNLWVEAESGGGMFRLERRDDLDSGLVTQMEKDFGSVEAAMLLLFQVTMGGADWSRVSSILRSMGPAYEAIFWFMQAFFQIAVMNILTAIFVEHTIAQSRPDHEDIIYEKRLSMLQSRSELREICKGLDPTCSGYISEYEFKKHMSDPGSNIRFYLELNGLEMSDAELLFRTLLSYNTFDNTDFERPGEVDITSFVNGCLRMRSGAASGLDVQVLLRQVQLLHQSCLNRFRTLSDNVDQLYRKVRPISAALGADTSFVLASRNFAASLASPAERQTVEPTMVDPEGEPLLRPKVTVTHTQL